MEKYGWLRNDFLKHFVLSLFLSIFIQLLGVGNANAQDPQLRAEIGPNKSYVILENSQIYVKYLRFTDNHVQFAIKELKIKSASNENQAGTGQYNYMDADAGRWDISSASIIYNGTDRKTVRLVWYGKNNDPSRLITHEVSIFPNSRYLKINYINVKYGTNVVDLGEPGGTEAGTHVAYGHSGWIRDYITHTYPLYHGSYYNRYPNDGVYDPVNGGSLNYNGHFIVGVYNPTNGRGFARTMPVVATSIFKLLLETYKRRGLEMFPYPFGQSHPSFTGYLYVVTGGSSEILTVGKQLANGSSVTPPPPPPPTGTEYNLTASVISGSGTVAPTSGTYAESTTVTLNANPNAGYCMLQWNGTNNDNSTSTTNTVTMSSNKTVTVSFTSDCVPTSYDYDLRLSSSSNRTGSVALDGEIVSGDIYVFTSPDPGVERVTFYLDGKLHREENGSPYDFEGTKDGLANPFDTTTLNDGQHEIRAVIDLTTGGMEEVSGTFSIANDGSTPPPTTTPGQYELMMSSSVGLTAPVPLDGKTVSGEIYVYTSPDSDVDRVTFYLDGSYQRAENFSPYDFAGSTSTGLPKPFDTAELYDGQHEITAQIILTDGSVEEITANFTAANGDGSGSYQLLVSPSSSRSNAVALGGKTVSGNVYVFTSPDEGIARVAFYLDGSSYRMENFSPYDFAGSASSGLANPFDTNKLNDGQHEIRAVIDLANGGAEELTGYFTVNN